LDVSSIFTELTTPKNLDKYDANEVTKITTLSPEYLVSDLI